MKAKRYQIEASLFGTRLIVIEAESLEGALAKFHEGDYDQAGIEDVYGVEEVLSIDEVKK